MKALAQRAEKAIKTQIYIIGFLDILKKYIQKKESNISPQDAYQKGETATVKSKIVVCKKGEEHTWIFSLFGKDNLTLADKYNGKCSIYSQKPLDPKSEMDRGCMSIVEFLVFELINQRVKKEQLEKILFEIL